MYNEEVLQEQAKTIKENIKGYEQRIIDLKDAHARIKDILKKVDGVNIEAIA